MLIRVRTYSILEIMGALRDREGTSNFKGFSKGDVSSSTPMTQIKLFISNSTL